MYADENNVSEKDDVVSKHSQDSDSWQAVKKGIVNRR